MSEVNLGSIIDQKVVSIFYMKVQLDQETEKVVGLQILLDKEVLRMYINREGKFIVEKLE